MSVLRRLSPAVPNVPRLQSQKRHICSQTPVCSLRSLANTIHHTSFLCRCADICSGSLLGKLPNVFSEERKDAILKALLDVLALVRGSPLSEFLLYIFDYLLCICLQANV